LAAEEQWARHNITPSVEPFHRSKIFLVESGSVSRIVYSLSPYSFITVVEIGAEIVDAALESVRLALARVYEDEVARSGNTTQ
jgi:hypothetical protein